MKKTLPPPLYILLGIFLAICSCKKDELEVIPTPTKSSAKEITKFSFAALSPAVEATIDATAKTIKATLPAGTDETKLVPTILISEKATLSPGNGVFQDFSKEVSYTVMAEDGSIQVWKVIVVLAKPVDNGTVYAGNYDGFFYAVDASNGTKKWEVKLPKGINATPSLANGIVYISCLDKKLYAFEAATGIKKWDFLHGKSNDFSSPTIMEGVIYLGGGTEIYALDAATGTKKWEFTGDGIYSWDASPTVLNGTVYGIIRGSVGGKSGIYALDAKTGVVKWNQPNYGLIESSPAIANGLIFTGNESHNVLAFDSNTGSLVWEYKTNDFITFSAPTVFNGMVYIGSWDKKLYALDITNGTKKWDFATDGWINSSPYVANGIVYFGSNDDKLYALDATTGIKKWTVELEKFAYVESSPLVNNNTVFVTSGKSIYALDATTGVEKWKFQTSRSFGKSSPCLLDKNGKVFHSGISGIVQ